MANFLFTVILIGIFVRVQSSSEAFVGAIATVADNVPPAQRPCTGYVVKLLNKTPTLYSPADRWDVQVLEGDWKGRRTSFMLRNLEFHQYLDLQSNSWKPQTTYPLVFDHIRFYELDRIHSFSPVTCEECSQCGGDGEVPDQEVGDDRYHMKSCMYCDGAGSFLLDLPQLEEYYTLFRLVKANTSPVPTRDEYKRHLSYRIQKYSYESEQFTVSSAVADRQAEHLLKRAERFIAIRQERLLREVFDHYTQCQIPRQDRTGWIAELSDLPADAPEQSDASEDRGILAKLCCCLGPRCCLPQPESEPDLLEGFLAKHASPSLVGYGILPALCGCSDDDLTTLTQAL